MRTPKRAPSPRSRSIGFGKMRDVDHEIDEARAREALDQVHDERPAAGLEQRLGYAIGERAHALAAARGQDHRLHAVARWIDSFIGAGGCGA